MFQGGSEHKFFLFGTQEQNFRKICHHKWQIDWERLPVRAMRFNTAEQIHPLSDVSKPSWLLN